MKTTLNISDEAAERLADLQCIMAMNKTEVLNKIIREYKINPEDVRFIPVEHK